MGHLTLGALGAAALGKPTSGVGFAGSPLVETDTRRRFSQTSRSRINGVRIGAITYSFRGMSEIDDIVKAYQDIGLGEVELMSNHAESAAGVPSAGGGGRRGGDTPEAIAAREAVTKWRQAVTLDTFKPVRKKFEDAGVTVSVLCYNMSTRTTDEEIEYAFTMARSLGASTISTSTQVSMAKRIAPFADKHRIRVGFHNHSNLKDPNEVATPESFTACMDASKYHGVNLDIGHFTAANFDAVAYLDANHARITNLHLKDRGRDQGNNVPWGQGNTPIKEVLTLLRTKKYDIPANIEFEYRGEPVAEVKACFEFCKTVLQG
jgi:sugar phosphate isomerase/epimerase